MSRCADKWKSFTPLLVAMTLCWAQSTWAAITFVSVSAPAPSSSASNSIVIPTPSGLVLDDTLIATISYRGGNSVGATPSGWFVIATAGSGQNVTTVVYRKLVGASEPASYTWNLSSSARVAGAIQAFRGVDASDPVAASSTSYSGSNATSLVATAVTPGVGNAMLVATWAVTNGNATVTSPVGMSERYSLSGGAGPNGVAMASATEAYVATTSTGTRTATSSASLQYASILLALRPRLEPVGAWYFDESQWNGVAAEVLDASGNGNHGRSYAGVNTTNTTPAIPGATGTCRYGAFDGSNDYVEIPHNALLNGDSALTYTAWIRPSSWSGINQVMAKSVHGGGSGRAQMGMFSESGVFKGRAESNAGRYEVQTTLPAINQWTHVGLVFSGTALTLFVNGVATVSTAFAATTLIQNSDPLAISKRVGTAQYFFAGGIDEVRVYRVALTQGQLASVMGETRPCSAPAGAARFQLSHAGYGIHCRTEPIAMAVLDGVNGLVGSYSGLVSMTTQSGRGTWTLVAGNGSLVDSTPNDGLATYQFVPADGGQVTFGLSYPEGSSPLDVEMFQNSDPTIRDDDTEGLLAFAPSGFTITANALANPPPGSINDPLATQTAGMNFALHVAAFGQTATDPVCGVIESYTGAKSLSWWMNYIDPNSGFVTATVNSVAVGSSEPSAVAQNVTFTQGQAAVAVKYKDVGSIRIQAKDGAAQPQVIRGNSNAFVVRPATLAVSRVETLAGAANPGATTATGPVFVASGAPFRVEVDLLDAEGSRTPNYGRELVPEGLNVASSSLVVPVGGRNGSSGTGVLGSGSAFVATATAGRFRNDSVTFDEVGIVRLMASVADGNYLGTGALTGTASGNVGRFRPESFALVPGAAVTAACGTFTYMAQPALSVNYVIEARNALAARTWNYDAGLLGAGAVATVAAAAENANAGTDFGSRLSNVVGVWTLGQSSRATSTASFARLVAPDGPYDSLQIGMSVNDPIDGVLLVGRNLLASAPGDCVAAGTCDAIAIGAPTGIRYGRLMVKPAFGPETQVLAVPLEAQYFDGVFQPNTADTCTTYAIAQGALGSYSGNLLAGATSLVTPMSATALVGGGSDPNARLTLSAPGIGSDGSVDVTLDVPTHLEFDWTGIGASDPTGTARFGRYRGHDRIIFWRER